MKKKIKIVFDADILDIIIPGASDLDGLPRKKKKKLKKYVAKKIMEIALDEALRKTAFEKLGVDPISI
jgi:hypothetical protein